MAYLDDLEEQGGGFEGLLQHADRNNRFGGWTLRRRWPTNGGYTINTIVNCPFFKQTKCPCQVKIIYGQSMITLLSTNIHTPDDHSEEKNRLKFLTPKAKKLIKTAVKIAPHQTATDLLRNVQGSPTKRINNDLKQSVARAIRKERVNVNKVTLGGIELDNTLGTV